MQLVDSDGVRPPCRAEDPIRSVSDGQTVNFSYDKTRLAQTAFPNGVTTDYTYEVNGWLNGINSVGPQGTVLTRDYGFDGIGNILTKSSEHGSYGYGYGATNQLTSADNPQLPDEAYSYDQVGNRLTSQETTGDWTYNENTELLGYDDVTFEYDANGNTVKKTEGGQVTTYVYNARNRLEKVYLPDGRVASYAYDPFGRRFRKQVGNEVICFAYADEGLVGEYDGSGGLGKSYGWYPGGLWGTNPVYMVEGGSFYFYHADHLGTPQRMTDISGKTVWSAGYAAFGEARVDPLSTITNNLRFPGQYFDPEIGRFSQIDPIGFAAGDTNLFRYAQNNPIFWIDPYGLVEYRYTGPAYFVPTGEIRTESYRHQTSTPVPTGLTSLFPKKFTDFLGIDMNSEFTTYKDFEKTLVKRSRVMVHCSDDGTEDLQYAEPEVMGHGYLEIPHSSGRT